MNERDRNDMINMSITWRFSNIDYTLTVFTENIMYNVIQTVYGELVNLSLHVELRLWVGSGV